MERGWIVAVLGVCALIGCSAAGGGTAKDGSSEAAVGPSLKSCGADGLLDDCEDNNNQVAKVKNRNGYWYTFGDTKGTTITPALGGTFAMSAGGAKGSGYAAHVSGKIGTASPVYAGVGVNFVDPKAEFDASAYKGISFWAKVGEGSTTKVRLKVPDVDTDPDGNVCKTCYNDFGADFEFTTKWRQYTVAFADMKQMPYWGDPQPPAINPKKIYALQWQVNTPGASYDVWIDDVQFVGCP